MPNKQRKFHIVTEILAIPVGIYLIYKGLKIFDYVLVVIGIGNILIDGWLLFKWLKKK